MIDAAAVKMGWNILIQVEQDTYCQSILKQRFPNVQKHTDVKDFSGKKYAGCTDIIFGGFPCQPASHSGKRLGENDNRWLWPEMLRVAIESQANWIVAENVYGLLTLNDGREIQRICTDLENAGYQKPVIFDCTADTLGLPTLERHIWIITQTNGKRLQDDITRPIPKLKKIPAKFQRGNTRDGKRWDLSKSRVLNVGQRNSETLAQLKAIGNAVPPEMAFQIFRTIDKFISLTPQTPK